MSQLNILHSFRLPFISPMRPLKVCSMRCLIFMRSHTDGDVNVKQLRHSGTFSKHVFSDSVKNDSHLPARPVEKVPWYKNEVNKIIS